MIVKVKIAGRKRELWKDRNDNWFLNRPEDIGELEIYCGYTLEQWNDADFLWRISPRTMKLYKFVH